MAFKMVNANGFYKIFPVYLEKKKRQLKKLPDRLDEFGAEGVSALSAATPKLTGEAANSWSYEIERNGTDFKLVWHNSVSAGSVPLAVILQYGHATRGGGYVEGIDYINPALKPVFERLARKILKDFGEM